MLDLHLYIKMNWGKRPNQGRGTANKHEQGRGKRPHLSRLGTIQITMISIINPRYLSFIYYFSNTSIQ